MPPERIELPAPGLQDQCSATELKRLLENSDFFSFYTIQKQVPIKFALRPGVKPGVYIPLANMIHHVARTMSEISVFSREQDFFYCFLF